VGSVYSPTQFGMIHFTHDKRELAAKGKRILAALDREIWRLNRTRGEVATTFVQDQRNLADTVIKEIIQRWRRK
jgi:sorbitol-specific phosphotransferase system component IIBC